MFTDAPITIYAKITDRTGKPGTVGEFLMMGYRYREQIERYRRTGDSTIKKTLPCATISGVFAPERRADNLRQHSGLLCIDIDHTPDPERALDVLSRMRNVAYASRSVSGKGVFAIVPIAYPDKHKQQFESLRRMMQAHGLKLDQACSDVSRLRVLSYDEDFRYRPDAEPYRGIWEEPEPIRRQPTLKAPREENERIAEAICTRLEQSGINIAEDYRDWFRICAALVEGLGENGRQYFHRLSSMSGKYRESTCDRKFNELLRSGSRGITFATLCHYAKPHLPDWGEVLRDCGLRRDPAADFDGIDLTPDPDIEAATSAHDHAAASAHDHAATSAHDHAATSAHDHAAASAHDHAAASAHDHAAASRELEEPPRSSVDWVNWLFGLGRYKKPTGLINLRYPPTW